MEYPPQPPTSLRSLSLCFCVAHRHIHKHIHSLCNLLVSLGHTHSLVTGTSSPLVILYSSKPPDARTDLPCPVLRCAAVLSVHTKFQLYTLKTLPRYLPTYLPSITTRHERPTRTLFCLPTIICSVRHSYTPRFLTSKSATLSQTHTLSSLLTKSAPPSRFSAKIATSDSPSRQPHKHTHTYRHNDRPSWEVNFQR